MTDLLSKLAGILIHNPVTDYFRAKESAEAELIEAHPFALDIEFSKAGIDEYYVTFNYYDNLEKDMVQTQTLRVSRGEISEDTSTGHVLAYTEAKLSDRGERLIYSSSLHFREMMMFQERMAVRIPQEL